MIQPVPINERPYYGTDPVANAVLPTDIYNCLLEQAPGVGLVLRQRPGVTEFADLATGAKGDGLFWWDPAQRMIAVSGGQVFELFEDGTFTNLSTSEETAAQMVAGTKVIFAEGQAINGDPWLYMANGVLAYLAATDAYPVAPGDENAPNAATHVAWMTGRFLAGWGGTNYFSITGYNPEAEEFENDFWSLDVNPFVCNAKGDKLDALLSTGEQTYAWGRLGAEVWQDDGTTPVSPVPSAFVEIGLEAVYSLAVAGDTFFLLGVVEGKRVVVRVSPAGSKIISEAIEDDLAGMDTISDAIGDLISVGGLSLYLLTFPTENKTWAYDAVANTWVPWSSFDTRLGNHNRYKYQYACYARGWNKHLIMSSVDGKIYEMGRETFTDDGDEIRTFYRTVWMDGGNSGSLKRAKKLTLKLKRGHVATGKVLLRWADNGSDLWSPSIELPLTPVGDRIFIVELPGMGTYYSRRYEFNFTDDADFVLVAAFEDVELV